MKNLTQVTNVTKRAEENFNTIIGNVVPETINMNEGDKKVDSVKHKDIVSCNTLLKGEAKERYDNSRYISKDLSWIEFNKRVMGMAEDIDIPVMDRLRFLSISASNLDEFNSVRYGSLLNKVEDNPDSIRYGLSVSNESKLVSCSIKTMRKDQLKIFNDIKIDIERAGIKIFNKSMMDKENGDKKIIKQIDSIFENYIYPAMTPIVFDESRPFPFIKNNTINVGAIVEDKNTSLKLIATMQVPDVGFRYIEIKDSESNPVLITIEELVLANLDKLFINKKIVTSCVYRLLRNSDIEVTNISNHKFLTEEMNEALKKREIGDPIMLEITDTKKELYKVITKALDIKKKHVNKTNFVGLATASKIKANKIDMNVLSEKKFKPQVGEMFVGENNTFDLLDKEDVLLHHPYESFDHIIKMLEEAAEDPNVVAIKQTLYRVSKNSPIVKALIKAAKSGKQVTCLLEVKARFNEEDNLKWAEQLENAGAHVIYGVDNLKTHCKMLMIVRNSKKGLKRYCHLSTGNYNEITGRIYTDISYFTSNNKICDDVTKLFNTLTGYSEPRLKKLISAPHNMRTDLYQLIDNEIALAKLNQECGIIIKCNSIDDVGMIDKLYEASEAGVKITLIVRGICCLRTQQEYSKNIRVISVVGRFLEHSRIYSFKASNEVYIGSADVMERNISRRFELLTPVVSKQCKDKVEKIIETFVSDDTCYELFDREYAKLTGDNSSQLTFMTEAEQANAYNNINKIYIRRRK